MFLYFFIFHILLITSTYGGNTTLTKTVQNKTMSVNEKTKYNKGNVTLVSEGGSIGTERPSYTLPRENHTLLSLDKELGKNKEKPVVPRKGVYYNAPEDNVAEINNTQGKHNSTDTSHAISDDKNDKLGKSEVKLVVPHKEVEYKSVKKNVAKTNLKVEKYNHSAIDNHLNDVSGKNKSSLLESVQKSEKINGTTVRKPLILNYEALTSNQHKNPQSDHLDLSIVKSSSKDLVSDQIPSPKTTINGPTYKTAPMSANRHPGMIMPVVITILVVPMFAILGYMALRRGQEAWKNRHYKRMDFLLDGMYND